MTNKTAWKILKKGMVSYADSSFKWRKGKWYEHKGELQLCKKGFHASKLLVDALYFVIPGIICKVEYKGKIVEDDDKFVAEKMRVVKTYRFTKRMAVEFSIYCARSCLKKWSDNYKDDDRPLKAIQAAEAWLKNPTRKNRDLAWSAGSAAWSAAGSAAWSAAGSAAGSAGSAAWSAGSAAWSAAGSAAGSAGSAAWSAEKNKLNNKLLRLIGAKK